jgi:hypothetical protein
VKDLKASFESPVGVPEPGLVLFVVYQTPQNFAKSKALHEGLNIIQGCETKRMSAL